MRNWEEICGDTQGKASGIGTGVQDVKNWQFIGKLLTMYHN